MSYYKDRLTTTISASLVQWRLRENGGVEGMIYDSQIEEYKDGDQMLFLNTKLVHYPRADGFWPDHWIMTNQTGQHFMLAAKDQLP